MLEARGLTKCYATLPAVSDVSFRIQPGEILGYLGPNGSGKSTTVKMLTGLLDPTRGEVLLHGRNIREDLTGYKKRLGYVPEDALLYPYLTGWEYLEFIGTLRGMAEHRLRRRIDGLLRLLMLHPHRHATISSYSKGMRQRVLLIAALMDDPEILVFDEPLSGLDVTSALVFRKLVKQLGAQGRIIVYCSHVLEVVEKICTHVLMLRKGMVVACGSVSRVQQMAGLTSLEDTFSHYAEEQNAEETVAGILEAIKS